MPEETVKKAGIKQPDGTYDLRDIAVDFSNVEGLESEATSFKAKKDNNGKDITDYIANITKNNENRVVVVDGNGNEKIINLNMTGATEENNGNAGFVPAPTINDRNKFLKGDGTWEDVTSGVSGVKGDSEETYRSGEVNITKDNIGLGNVRNEDIGDEDISGIGSTVKGAILALQTSFSQALTDLKATPIAQAVGALTTDSFAQVIDKLATIINRGKVEQVLDVNTTSYTIPQGYHNGEGNISINTQTKNVTPSTSSQVVSSDEGKVLSSVTVDAINTQEKATTAGTTTSSVIPDAGKYLSKVTINPTPSQEKTVTSSRSAQTVTPDSGKLLSKVIVNGLAPTGTYTASSRSSSLDMGATSNYRYVNTNSVPNTNSTVHTPTVKGYDDLGTTNNVRYVDTRSIGVNMTRTSNGWDNLSGEVYGDIVDTGVTYTHRLGFYLYGTCGNTVNWSYVAMTVMGGNDPNNLSPLQSHTMEVTPNNSNYVCSMISTAYNYRYYRIRINAFNYDGGTKYVAGGVIVSY